MTEERFNELANLSQKEWNKWRRNKPNDEEYGEWFSLWRQKEDECKKTLDLREYVGISSDSVRQGIKDILADKGNVYPNGSMTPYGAAICAALWELEEETLLLERARYQIQQTQFKDKTDISNVVETEKEYADCGCCIESGGHLIVTFKSGLILEFGNDGRLIDESGNSGFKWLKL